MSGAASGSPFRIRRATPADAEAVVPLGRAVATQPLLSRYAVSPDGLAGELHRLARAMADADPDPQATRLLLAEQVPIRHGPTGHAPIDQVPTGHGHAPVDQVPTGQGHALIGFARFQPIGCLGPGAYLQLIALLPGAEGQGTGSALLAAVEAEAARKSRALFLLTADFNHGAQRFYRRHGYDQVGLLPDYVRPGIAELLFYKRLRSG